MQLQIFRRRRIPARPRACRWGVLVLFALLTASVGGAASTETQIHVITQKGRAFHPLTIAINRNEILQFFNDDGDLLHHAYVENYAFSFDSGDQLPGTRTNVAFSVPGTFNVLCGIHPKMLLVVTVK